MECLRLNSYLKKLMEAEDKNYPQLERIKAYLKMMNKKDITLYDLSNINKEINNHIEAFKLIELDYQLLKEIKITIDAYISNALEDIKITIKF